MSTTPETPTQDYGEPWTDNEWRGMADCEDRTGTPIIRDFHFLPDSHRARIVACVNACAGMADPAADIEAMRAAIKEAYDAVILGENPLPKLRPFLKP